MSNKQRRKAHSPAPSGRRFSVLCAAALVLTTLTVGLRALPSPVPRLEVAGFRISQEEYLRAMYQARSDVLSDHAAAGISLTDWHTPTTLGDPSRLITERALDILSEYYAVGTLAAERGYLADPGYEAMLRDMEQVNLRRREALNSGGMVTGLPQFTVDDYITYRASNLRLQFCSDPANPEVQVSEEDILRRYEADRENLYRQPDSMELAFLSINAAPGEADALEASLQELRLLALQEGALAPALEALPQLKAHYREVSVEPATYGFYSRSMGDVLFHAAGLQAGELSQVLRQEDWLCLIQCRSRTAHNFVPLEEVRSLVVQSIRESRYDALIAARMEATQLTGNLQALYRFTAEQLPK